MRACVRACVSECGFFVFCFGFVGVGLLFFCCFFLGLFVCFLLLFWGSMAV